MKIRFARAEAFARHRYSTLEPPSWHGTLKKQKAGLFGAAALQGRSNRGRKEGGRRSGERTLRNSLSCSVLVSHAGGPHVASFVVDRPCACVRACVQAWRNALRVARRNGRVKTRVGTLNKKKASHVRCEAENSESGARALARAAMRFLCGCPCVIVS